MSNEFDSISRSVVEGNAREHLSKRSSLENGSRSQLPLFQRFIIIDVVQDPTIIDRTKLEYWEHDLGVANMQHASVAPRNSIIARRVQSNNTTTSEQAMILYPMFPPTLSLPCQPGEQVWVMFEDPAGTRNDLGYWMCRIVGPSFVEDVNHTHHHRANDPSFVPGTIEKFEGSAEPSYEFRNGSVGVVEGERYTIAETSSLPNEGEDAYKKIILDSDGGKTSLKESVPRYRKRASETVIEGSNNALISVGTDRTTSLATYDDDPKRGKIPRIPSEDSINENAGSIDLVAGRGQTISTGGQLVQNSLQKNELRKGQDELVANEGDVDLKNDRSRIRISQRTKTDENFQLSTFNLENFSIEDSPDGDGSIVIKSDKIRLIARSDIELLVKTFERDANGKMVDVDDENTWAAIVIKNDGSIVLKPAQNNVLKLGSDDADKAILCTDIPATVAEGIVSAPPIISTMGGQLGGSRGDAPALAPGQGRCSSKVLIK